MATGFGFVWRLAFDTAGLELWLMAPCNQCSFCQSVPLEQPAHTMAIICTLACNATLLSDVAPVFRLSAVNRQ